MGSKKVFAWGGASTFLSQKRETEGVLKGAVLNGLRGNDIERGPSETGSLLVGGKMVVEKGV